MICGPTFIKTGKYIYVRVHTCTHMCSRNRRLMCVFYFSRELEFTHSEMHWVVL